MCHMITFTMPGMNDALWDTVKTQHTMFFWKAAGKMDCKQTYNQMCWQFIQRNAADLLAGDWELNIPLSIGLKL